MVVVRHWEKFAITCPIITKTILLAKWVRHQKLENGMDLLLFVRHRGVYKEINECITEIGGVYNRSMKGIKRLTNEA